MKLIKLQHELNHSEEMMASSERGISSAMSTGYLQADVSGQQPGIARSTRMLQLGSSPESLRLYIPFLYFINTICCFFFSFANKNHVAFCLRLCHLLLCLSLCQDSSSATCGASHQGHMLLEKGITCVNANVAAFLISELLGSNMQCLQP